MNRRAYLLASLVLVGLAIRPTRADLIIDIGSASLAAGSTKTIDVYISSDAGSATPDMFNQYGVQFLITPSATTATLAQLPPAATGQARRGGELGTGEYGESARGPVIAGLVPRRTESMRLGWAWRRRRVCVPTLRPATANDRVRFSRLRLADGVFVRFNIVRPSLRHDVAG